MSEPQRQLDTRAIEIAGKALQKIDSHEQICSVRQAQIMGKLDSLHTTMGWAVRGLIFLLLSIIGYFLIHGGIPQAKAHVASHPEWSAWFNEQLVPDGSYAKCCDHTDVFLIDEATELRSANGDPEVLIDGAWYVFPNRGVGKTGNTVMEDTGNPTGSMLAWLYHGQPRCLMGRSGT